MREAQLDIAEEFDLLIVIICSRRSVAERISEKQAGTEIVFMLLLSCFGNCLKTWVFSVGSNNACRFPVSLSAFQNRVSCVSLVPSLVFLFLRSNLGLSLLLECHNLLRNHVNLGTGYTSRGGPLRGGGGGCSAVITTGFWMFAPPPDSSCRHAGLGFLHKGFVCERWGCLGANKHQTAPEKSV